MFLFNFRIDLWLIFKNFRILKVAIIIAEKRKLKLIDEKVNLKSNCKRVSKVVQAKLKIKN